MSLEIPDSREDARIDREHAKEKLEHVKDHMGDEMRKAKDAMSHAKDEVIGFEKAHIGHVEKADRREEHEQDAAAAEEANTK